LRTCATEERVVERVEGADSGQDALHEKQYSLQKRLAGDPHVDVAWSNK
jgi:hypothetical protein